MLTLKKINELIEFYGLDLKASKPSLLSPFVLHRKNSDAWNNRIFEGKNLNELKTFIIAIEKAKRFYETRPL